MKPFEDDRFVAALESLRPSPSPAFAAELDERAAAGFPRRAGAEGDSPLRRLATWIGSIEPRRAFVPVSGVALAVLVAVTVVVAVGEGGSDTPSQLSLGHSDGMPAQNAALLPPEATRAKDLPGHGASGSGGDSAGIEYSEAPPMAQGAPSAASAGTEASSAGAAVGSPSSTGPYASRAPHRDVERSAQMVLGANADAVAGAAVKVFDTVHAYDGIVLSSSVSGGAAGHASADFELLIPSARLGDALAAFSGIAEVRSRHEATDDITAPTVRVGEHLRDARATIDGLLVQLAGADSNSERAEVEAELRSERRQAAGLRSSLAKLDRRANLSRVSLRIESSEDSGSSGSGAWGIDDALGDASHILGIAAGVAVIGLAILAPLALIALLAWLAARAWIHRGRERALD